MRISDWSSDVCSSDLLDRKLLDGTLPLAKGAGAMVARGLVPSPFDPRTRPLNLHQDWMPWAGCLSARRFDSVEAEYFAIRNQATLFDISPMHKYRVRGPDAERVMNRTVTSVVSKHAPGRVGHHLGGDAEGTPTEAEPWEK